MGAAGLLRACAFVLHFVHVFQIEKKEAGLNG
jgi:hypothetical protein